MTGASGQLLRALTLPGVLRAEAAGAVPIFCYPNGQPEDFGEREFTVMRELGFSAAVTGLPGYVERSPSGEGFEGCQLRRFPLSDRSTNFMQPALGFERIKQVVRGAAA